MCSAMFVVRLFSVLLVASLVDGHKVDQQEGHKITVRLPEAKPDDHDRTLEQKLWTPEISVHLLSLVEKINEKLATWDGRFGHLEDQVTTLQGSLTALQVNVDNMKSQMADSENRLERQISKISTDVPDMLENELNDLEDKIITKVTDLESKLDAEVNDLEDKLISKVTDLESKLDAEVNDLGDKIITKVTDLESKLDAEVNDLGDKIIRKVTDVIKDKPTDTRPLDVSMLGLGQELHNFGSFVVEGMTQRLDKLTNSFHQDKKELLGHFRNVTDGLEGKISDATDTLVKVGVQMSENVSVSWLNVREGIEGRAESLMVELHNVTSPLYEKVEGATSLLMSSVGKLEELPERVSEKMDTQLSNVNEKLSNKIDNELEILSKNLQESFDNTSLSFDRVISRIDHVGKVILSEGATIESCKKGMQKRSALPPFPYPFVYANIGTEKERQYLCDTTTEGGGWVVIQYRSKGETDFYRGWQDYKNGFGSIDTDYWIGLDTIYKFTSSATYELRIDLKYKGKSAYASYDSFSVASERDGYRLRVGSYSGTAGDSLNIVHNGDKFTTKDRDNDVYSSDNCAIVRQGAWWYRHCAVSNLNGKWGGQGDKGPYWVSFTGNNPASYTEMKIRRVDN